MDDVAGTGLEEHLMSDFEHMKTSPYLTDVVLLRHEGDTVNFFRSSDHQDTRMFRGEEQYRPCGIPVESVRVAKLETDSQS